MTGSWQPRGVLIITFNKGLRQRGDCPIIGGSGRDGKDCGRESRGGRTVVPDVALLRNSAVGISLVLSTLIYLGLGVWAGRYLDRRFDTEPLFLVVGLFVGMAGSLTSLYWQASALLRQPSRKASGSRDGGSSDRRRDPSGESRKEPDMHSQPGNEADG